MSKRRGLQALFASIFLLAGHLEAAQPLQVQFDSLDGTRLHAWLLQPASDVPAQRGVVIALHGCGGLYASTGSRKGQLNARHQAMADMLVGEGYAVLFPDSFTPRGEREICTRRIGQRSIGQTERRRDALAALNWAATQPWTRADRIALLGWSHGGSAVLAATDATQTEVTAQTQRFVTSIAFYPGCSAARKAGYRPHGPLTMMLGEKDDWTPPAPCIELGRTVGAEVRVFPGSYHDFDNPVGEVRLRTDVPNGVHPGQGVHVGRNEAARAQAYQRVREILAAALR